MLGRGDKVVGAFEDISKVALLAKSVVVVYAGWPATM